MITLSWQVSNDCGCLASDALGGGGETSGGLPWWLSGKASTW